MDMFTILFWKDGKVFKGVSRDHWAPIPHLIEQGFEKLSATGAAVWDTGISPPNLLDHVSRGEYGREFILPEIEYHVGTRQDR